MLKTTNKRIGTDGKLMSAWQIWLRRLCIVMIVWAGLELVLGASLLVSIQFIPNDLVRDLETLIGLSSQEFLTLLGTSSLVSAFFNVVIAFLGIRGAENPERITLFFWIAIVDAILTAWALAGNISNGVIDPTSLVSGLFIIILAVCAWQVRKQTGYFDRHP